MLTVPTSTSATNGQTLDPQPPDSGTPTQSTSATPLAPLNPQANLQDLTYPTVPSQLPNNIQGSVSNSAQPPRIPIFEYQWSFELVGQLLLLPPRSNFGGKFSIIADPSVDNVMRAHMFADQLRSHGVPIPAAQLASRAQATHRTHTLVFPCKCEGECSGRFLVSTSDDTTHPYGVPGQRIGVALYHPSSGL